MIKLNFDSSAFPRTMTRAEWKAADRWRRSAMRVIHKANPDLDATLAAMARRMVLHGQSAAFITNDGKITEVDPWA